MMDILRRHIDQIRFQFLDLSSPEDILDILTPLNLKLDLLTMRLFQSSVVWKEFKNLLTGLSPDYLFTLKKEE